MTPPDPSAFIARGASAEVYRLDGGRVFKLFHDGIDPGIVAREYAIAQAVQETGLPVARVVRLNDVGTRRGIVYTELRGPNLLAYLRQHPLRLSWGLEQMAALHQRVHGVAVPGLRSRKDNLAEDIEVADIDETLRLAALDRLDQLIERDQLSHGDLHPANLIVTDDGLFVIDWSKAARAAPAADVVRTEMLLRFGPGLSDRRWLDLARDAMTADYVRRYRRLSGMDRESLGAWRGLVALAWSRNRLPGRDAAFDLYLDRALAQAGLPPIRR